MTLAKLSLILGLGFALPQIYGLMKPKEFAAAARKFPRSLQMGWLLMLIGTLGFFYYLNLESISDFEPYKPYMFAAFGAVALGTCIFISDFLAVRGLAISLMLLAKLMCDTARWHPSNWRLVIITWAYLMVIAGIWFTVSPWRCRDFLNWCTATEQRIKMGSALRLAFAVLVVILGLKVF